MFAVVNIKGQQFKVSKDQEIFVHHVDGIAGNKVEFSDVILINNDDNTIISGDKIKSTVKAEILDHVQSDKVIAFKMRRRKGFRKKKGFRQQLTKIRIEEIA
ncbi:MAG: 50S ribosomal protein L21 [Chitinophagaceae bacterium]